MAAIADKYPFGRMRPGAAMVSQMLHLRAAAIADACGHFLCIGCAFEHRGSVAEKTETDE
jgi:hypothetical protein